MKKLLKKILLSCVFLSTILAFSPVFAEVEAVLGSPLNKNESLVLELPKISAPEIILSREQYIISYNKVRRAPNWAAWKLELNQFGDSGRSNDFAVDTELKNYLDKKEGNKTAVDPEDYRRSCYDRGHQTPSADRTNTEANNQTTFLMSNMIPQTAYLNRVVWEHLEAYSRSLVKLQGKKLYIIAGPIYDKDLGSIGPDKDIPVPSKNFKIIFILNADQSFSDISASTEKIAVVMPNIYQDGTAPGKSPSDNCPNIDTNHEDKNDWIKYKTTIDVIEKSSGISFSYAHNTIK
ncbi:MAG: DNA/RNA non-specific endonuclease [Bacteriovorax sp.]|nr:DNA/RNA non-specific endonuclease [Bacteriovorax sp.]